jgi:hypothetical protein
MTCKLIAHFDLVAGQLSVTSHEQGTAKLSQRCKRDALMSTLGSRIPKWTHHRATLVDHEVRLDSRLAGLECVLHESISASSRHAECLKNGTVKIHKPRVTSLVNPVLDV